MFSVNVVVIVFDGINILLKFICFWIEKGVDEFKDFFFVIGVILLWNKYVIGMVNKDYIVVVI